MHTPLGGPRLAQRPLRPGAGTAANPTAHLRGTQRHGGQGPPCRVATMEPPSPAPAGGDDSGGAAPRSHSRPGGAAAPPPGVQWDAEMLLLNSGGPVSIGDLQRLDPPRGAAAAPPAPAAAAYPREPNSAQRRLAALFPADQQNSNDTAGSASSSGSMGAVAPAAAAAAAAAAEQAAAASAAQGDVWGPGGDAESEERGGYFGPPAPLPRALQPEDALGSAPRGGRGRGRGRGGSSSGGGWGGRGGGGGAPPRGSIASRQAAAARSNWRAPQQLVQAAPGLTLILPSSSGGDNDGRAQHHNQQQYRQQRQQQPSAEEQGEQEDQAAGAAEGLNSMVPQANHVHQEEEEEQVAQWQQQTEEEAPAAAHHLDLESHELTDQIDLDHNAADDDSAAFSDAASLLPPVLPVIDSWEEEFESEAAAVAAAEAAAVEMAKDEVQGDEGEVGAAAAAGDGSGEGLAVEEETAASAQAISWRDGTAGSGKGAAAAADSGAAAQQSPPPRQRRLRPQAADGAEESPERMAALFLLNRWGEHAVSARQVWHAASTNPIDSAFLDTQSIVLVNLSLTRLGEWRLEKEVRRLAQYALERPDCNEHTYAAAFSALSDVGRAAEAIAIWDKLSGAGVDMGPVGASAIIKVCARARDAAAGLRIFERMLRRRINFNRYTYNAVMHLCAVTGRADDALAVYNIMRLETEPSNLPDLYTYAALVRAIVLSKRYEMTGPIFENFLEDDIPMDAPLACHLITAAARGGDVRLARSIYRHALTSLEDPAAPSISEDDGSKLGDAASEAGLNHRQRRLMRYARAAAAGLPSPGGGKAAAAAAAARVLSIQVVNALLGAHAHAGDLTGALRVYQREVMARGSKLPPDTFTFTSLLTAAARAAGPRGLPLSIVEGLRAEMDAAGARLNGHLGSALINAYRRVRGAAPVRGGEGALAARGAAAAAAAAASVARVGGRTHPDVAAALARASEVLSELRRRRLANAQVYSVLAAFHLEQGAADAAVKLMRQAEEEDGVQLGLRALDVLARAAEDGDAPLELTAALRRRENELREGLAAARDGVWEGEGGGGNGGGSGGRRGEMPQGYSVRPGRG